MSNTCPKCGEPVPEGRLRLGFRECTACSSVDQYGCVDVVYHKTGNSVQPLPREVAERINKAGERCGFGIMRGMRGGKSPKRKLELGARTRLLPKVQCSAERFEALGGECIALLEKEGRAAALDRARAALRGEEIGWQDFSRLERIIRALPAAEPIREAEPRRNPYAKIEPRPEPGPVSEEIEREFRRGWR
jgi:hypothetical protein